MPPIQHKIQQFETVADLRAMAVLPMDNNQFFCEETNLYYDFDPSLTLPDDGVGIIALNSFPTSGRLQAVNYAINGSNIPRPILELMPNGEPQGNITSSPPAGLLNTFKLRIKYPSGYDDFNKLVLTGRVRVQLKHYDGRPTVRNTNKDTFGNVTITRREKQRMASRYAIHRNGALDAGDNLFGSAVKDIAGNNYPDRDTMFYIPSTQLAGQPMDFTLDPKLWYGYGGAANCGTLTFPEKVLGALTDSRYKLCGETNKNYFPNSGKPLSMPDRKYFEFVFMYKVNGKWVAGAPSQKFYIDLKIGTTDDGAGEIVKWVYGFRCRFA